jgi:hypothetical protein
MLGHYQHSHVRIEVDASENRLAEAILCPEKFQQWLSPQRFMVNLPDRLAPDFSFTSWFGLVAIEHHVKTVEANHVQLLLSRGIDGFHQWDWGEGWVQSRLEGISLLPLNLGQTYSLLRLQKFLER